jgi:hypothetical protein
MSRVSARRSVGTNRICARPVSALATSNRMLTIWLSRRALSLTSWSFSPPSTGGSACSASFKGSRIRVSGVRSSWLTVLKKEVLARSISISACARRRSSSNARAWAKPLEIWSATSPRNER